MGYSTDTYVRKKSRTKKQEEREKRQETANNRRRYKIGKKDGLNILK